MIIEAILTLLTAYLVYVFVHKKLPKNFPPGPPNYPIVGASLAISKYGKTAAEAFRNISKEYGPVVGMYLGNTKAVVINGYEASKAFYARDDFAHRPIVFTAGYLWGGRQLGVFFSNGKLWQEQRRFTIRHLRDLGFAKTSMEGLIHEECTACVDSIKKDLKKAGPASVIQMDNKFGVSVINILWSIIGGARYNHEDKEFQKLLQIIQSSFRAGNIGRNFVNAYPFLRHFPYFKQELEDLVAGTKALIDMLKVEIEKHEKTRDPSSNRDFIDVYLKALEENKDDPNSTFSMDQLLQTAQDLFAAGAESTSNSIAFVILHLMRNPQCQKKAQEELDRVLGKNQLASYEDRSRLPYTYAVITESFRMSPVAPVSVPHFNLEDTEFMGYYFPKETTVIVNFPSANMDEKDWIDPEVFRPERFLDNEGNFLKSKAERVFGFGAGKRFCLGENLARISNFIISSAIIQRFNFECEPGKPIPSIDPVEGFTVAPQPFSAKVTVR